MCLFGEQGLQQLQDWLGQLFLCSVICCFSKTQNKPKGKEKRKKMKHTWQMPNSQILV
jgi:hypothetical protein